MKNKTLLILLFVLFQFAAYSQVTITLTTCGSQAFAVTGTDATGRNIYEDASGFFAVKWNATSNQWEIIELPSTLWHHNTFASFPDPPCHTAGTWMADDTVCGTVSLVTGDCQNTLVGIEDVSASHALAISVYPNPGSGLFHVNGLWNGGTIEVYDLAGRLVWNMVTAPGETTIDLRGKEKGVYVYRIQDKKSGVSQGKLTVL